MGGPCIPPRDFRRHNGDVLAKRYMKPDERACVKKEAGVNNVSLVCHMTAGSILNKGIAVDLAGHEFQSSEMRRLKNRKKST
jgi:hypothetical protein